MREQRSPDNRKMREINIKNYVIIILLISQSIFFWILLFVLEIVKNKQEQIEILEDENSKLIFELNKN